MIFWFFQNWKNELKLDKAPFNALSLLEEIEISAGVRAKEKDWNLILLSLMQSCSFIGDEMRLSQIVNNLINNIKFTAEGFVSFKRKWNVSQSKS
jgi:signal transduction histidine kinase